MKSVIMLTAFYVFLSGCNSSVKEKSVKKTTISKSSIETKEEYDKKEKYLTEEHSSRLKKDQFLRDRLVKLSIELHKKGFPASEIKIKLDEEAARIEKGFASAPK